MTTASGPVIGCFERNCFDTPSASELYTWKKLSTFHGKVIRTFSALSEQHKVRTVAIRCLIVVISPLVYLALSLAFVGEWLLNLTRSNLDPELNRLRQAGILTRKTELAMDTAILANYQYRSSSNSKEIKILLSQALEIKRAYGKDHYVFTHGQGGQWYVISQLIKALVITCKIKQNVDSFEFLRSTKRVSKLDATQYSLALKYNQIANNDHDHETRSSLVSSDAYLLNTYAGESSLYFLTTNSNILSGQNPNALQETCESILKDYLPNTKGKKISECAQKIATLAKRINTVCGHLFVICIPKLICEDNLANIGYLSHPWGKPCDCHPDTNPIAILEGMQAWELNTETLCADGTPPQFRLMTNMVTPEIGVHSFILSTFTTRQRNSISLNINTLIADVAGSQ